MLAPTPPKPLAVSVGEPAGIGPDVILQAWMAHHTGELPKLPTFVLLCDPDQIKNRAHTLGLDVPTYICAEPQAFMDATSKENFKRALPIHPLENSMSAYPGELEKTDVMAVVEAITTGVDLIKSGHASGLVTLPIHKKALYDAEFHYPGHTEYLGYLAGQWSEFGEQSKPVMMLAGPDLRTVPVTIHTPLKDVPAQLTTDLIVETGIIVARDLKEKFGIAKPKLALAGLNPHAGEDGSLGLEEESIILPAIRILWGRGVDCIGPLPADTMFHASARERYDVALCMYHDQALIPAKALAFDEAVNVTLGLPFIRTSPDHGTALDIAGTGKARSTSTIAALNMAAEMAVHQAGVK